ncbi:hypothetical protein MPSEU_000135600 [Mayamaea pseudoterrestris]|nr:hypothetical protein MPSEU_000135600 [Mayamaea pseudoterrestris]
MSAKSSFKLTEKALESLLRGDAMTNVPMLLQVHFISDYDGYMAVDGSNKASKVRILDRSLRNDLFHIIFVRGAVASSVNAGLSEPLLYITTFDIFKELTHPLVKPPDTVLKLPSGKTTGGKAYDFFSRTTHFLSNADLSGCSVNATNDIGLPNDWSEKETAVSQFLEHDKAMHTISKSSAATTSSAFDAQSDCYLAAQSEFIASQLDRQKVSLTSNTGRQDAATSVKIAEQHALCLNTALEQDLHLDLTPELLCKWHGILCGNGIHKHAGVLRPKGVNVRVGQRSFRASEHIPGDIETACRALMSLEARLLRNGNVSSPRDSRSNQVSLSVAAVTFAAAIFFAIVDTHAFADGNGRLSRIAANWALRRAGIPFCVHFFATPAQRKEYLDALIQSRRNIFLAAIGNVEQEMLLDVFRDAKCLQPLVVLFMDRISRSVTEFNKLVKEKSTLLTDQAEAKAARTFRERAAAGNCLICFDENPNIATLCCGKAVHLNCMAEWLSSKNSFPQCRGDLPLLPPRLRAPDSNEEGEGEHTTNESDDSGGTTSSSIEADDTSMEDTMSMTSVFEHILAAPAPTMNADTSETTVEEEDETTATVDAPNAETEDTTMSTTDETTEIVAPPPNPNLPDYCAYGNCHNRGARDCTNASCGRCCLMHGRFSCNRHNAM